MTQFAIFATLMIVVVAVMVLPPLWLGLRAPKAKTNRKEMNLDSFRDQVADLEREKAEGNLSDANFEQAKAEVQRRLLEEVEPESAAETTSHGPSRKIAVFLLLLMPIFAVTGYALLGNPRALDPTQTSAPPKMTQEQINGMVAKLAEKMAANPDDLKGWLMLARSYKTMGRFEEAANAYGKAEKLVNEDPDLLASYAETIAMASNGKGLKGKPMQLVERWKLVRTRRVSLTGKPCYRKLSRVRKSTRCCAAASTR